MTERKSVDEAEISPLTKLKLEEARELMKTNDFKNALVKLTELSDAKLKSVEKALKYNLKGVILFNLNDVPKAILNFEVAQKYAPVETLLASQVQLNMASGHYKLNQIPELKNRLDKIDRKLLNEVELKKYAQLALTYGNKMEVPNLIVSSSLILMKGIKTIEEVKSNTMVEPMKEAFKKLSSSQKLELLEEFDAKDNLAVAYLAEIEAEDRYVLGDKSGATDVVNWIKDEYGSNEEVKSFIQEFEMRLNNSSRISTNDIGLVLPLTGEKSSFGQKALSGVDVGLKVLGLKEGIQIHSRDTMDNPAQGSQAVVELIRQKKVAFIIGGLFPDSAKAEYLEARKYGVLYISLSPINLPKEEKNHHLIEVQGSVESQVESLLSDEMLAKFGTRMGIIFPNNESGKSYMDEVWRRASGRNVQITSLATYPKNTHDYRDTAQLFLGLKYPRERSEELKILEDVYALEKSSIRRVQTLPPVIDFDWVFMASYPHEALGLIPTLGYYDANRIKIVGGPSWVASSLVKEQRNLGTMYFIGDDPKSLNQEVLKKFQDIYGKPAGLIEILSLDAMKIGAEVLNNNEASDRDNFDEKLRSKTLKGITTVWNFKDGIWMKQMNPMAITRGEIIKLFEGDTI
jgi:ABC-type branched-subunit amino acid transport system substrate-binding protein